MATLYQTCRDTDGHWAPKHRFIGELMTCLMCGKERQSDPGIGSGWTCIEIETKGYYVCPDDFPAPSASPETFREGYRKVLAHVLEDLAVAQLR